MHVIYWELFLLQFDEKKNKYEGEMTAAGLKEFISGNSLPLVIEFTQEVSKTSGIKGVRALRGYFGSL